MTGTCPHGWMFAHNCPTHAPDLSDYERAVVERIEAAPDVEESLRERVAVALYEATEAAEHTDWSDVTPAVQGIAYTMADAAIFVMRGET